MNMATLVRSLIISPLVAILALIVYDLVETGELAFPSDIMLLTIVSLAIFVGALMVQLTHGVSIPIHPSISDSDAPREAGTVKWFNTKKGYGFITRDLGDDVFVHYRSIRGQGRRSITDGQRVEFYVVSGNKGLQAEDVTPL